VELLWFFGFWMLALMMSLPSLESLGNLKGKYVLLRAGLNVPVEDGWVTNDFRLKRLLPTLQALHTAGACTVVLGHLGSEEPWTLAPVEQYFSRELPTRFLAKPPHLVTRDELTIEEGEFLFLENVRMSPGEKENDPVLGKRIASLGDVFINEAFADSHRKHASIVGPPQYLPSAFGLDFEHELQELSKAFTPLAPFVAIIGGAKIATKLPLVEKLLVKADRVYIAGALANTMYKARGDEIGRSVYDASEERVAKKLLAQKNIFVPEEVVVRAKNGTSIAKAANAVLPDENILDAGPNAVMEIAEACKQAQFVLWNGPLGHFESGFRAGTDALAEALSRVKAHTIVGGGDTISSIETLKLFDKFSFVSTGGGAMLDFLATETLPGIDAIVRRDTEC